MKKMKKGRRREGEKGRGRRKRKRRKGEGKKKCYEVLSTPKYLKPSSHSPENHTNLSFSPPWPEDCVIYAYSFGWQFFCGSELMA